MPLTIYVPQHVPRDAEEEENVTQQGKSNAKAGWKPTQSQLHKRDPISNLAIKCGERDQVEWQTMDVCGLYWLE